MKTTLIAVTVMAAVLGTQARAAKVLTGDFVEVGRAHAGVSRSQASVELVNRTPHVLDVRFGRGTTRLASGEVLLLRTPGGDMALEVSSPTLGGDRLDATLRVEAAVHHSLTFAYEELPEGPRLTPSLDAPKDGTTAGTQPTATPARGARSREIAPQPSTQVAPEMKDGQGSPKSGPSWQKKKRSGRVDIGRKRKKAKH